MKRALYVFGTIVVSLLFGFALSSIEPYPYAHSDMILVGGATFFLIVAISLRNSNLGPMWILFGLATFACFAVASFWFWFGAMNHGWWFPPELPIVQQFYYVDGEAGYDAHVGNLFVVLWLFVFLAFVIRYLTRRSRMLPSVAGRANSGAPLS